MEFLKALLGTFPGAITQGLIWGIMAIGVYITYKIQDIADLTVDGSLCTGAAVCAVMMVNGSNVWVAMLCAVIAGMLCGMLTGIFHILLGIPAILAGILTQLILWSVNLKIMGKANVSLSARNYKVLLTLLDIPKSLLIVSVFTVVLIVLLYFFFGTELGCAIRSTGCNAAMSRAQGINTNLMKFIGLALSNGLVALSGALLCQYQGFSDINMGRGAIVVGLAAVIIGDVLLKKVGGNFALLLLGVSVGAVVYYLVYQIVIFVGLDADLLKMFSAIVVAIFLGAPYLKQRFLYKFKAIAMKKKTRGKGGTADNA